MRGDVLESRLVAIKKGIITCTLLSQYLIRSSAFLTALHQECTTDEAHYSKKKHDMNCLDRSLNDNETLQS